MSEPTILFSSTNLPPRQSGKLLDLPRQKAQWEWMSLLVHRLQPGAMLHARLEKEEAAFLILGGTCQADWGAGKQSLGKRKNGGEVTFEAETTCEIAECRAPSEAKLEPRLVTPDDVAISLRGGGNASRQIVDVITPAFPADKLVVIEVYTPGGNWSSYPPHKHDTHNPPAEVDLDEIYYYRMAQPGGFALQHLYSDADGTGKTLKTHDGDAVLVRDGYHSAVAGPGYDVYYLNFLAGSSRTLAVTEDQQHTWIRSTWNATDPRLPLVKK
jgi:5-deoxy-glucuronate isomerase